MRVQTRETPFPRARAVLQTAVESGATPGAVAIVLRRDGTVAELVVGRSAVEPEPQPLSGDTIFDLASLTKPVVTTAALVLLQQGQFCLDDPLARFLPAFASNGKEAIRLHHLLTHTGGLRAWYPLYTQARSLPETVEAIANLPLVSQPGTRVEYSDLGFVLLGAAMEKIGNSPLDRLLRELVLHPLGMAATGFNPPLQLRRRVAPTERDNAYEAEMVRGMGLSFTAWERGIAWGRVHDGNAAYALGGKSGHAGLFAPAGDLARWARMWLRDGEGLLHPRTVAMATRSWTDELAFRPAQRERRGLGWSVYQPGPMDLPKGSVRSGGDLLGPRAFGHTGFTGASVWIDRDLDLAVILLANRVHPSASPDCFGPVRARFHNAVVAALPVGQASAPADGSGAGAEARPTGHTDSCSSSA